MRGYWFFSLFVLLAVLLAACAPADPLASYDPYRAAAVADAAIAATQQAQARKMEQATLAAAQAKQETDLKVTQIAAEIQGTQAAWAFQITQAAATQQASLATLSARSTADSIMLTRTPAFATQAAIAAAVERDQLQLAQDRKYAQIPTGMIVALLLGGAGAYLIVWGGKHTWNRWLDWQDQRRSVIPVSGGTIVYIQRLDGGRGMQYIPSLPEPPPKLRAQNDRPPQIIDLNLQDQLEQIGSSTWASPPARSSPAPACLRLLRDTIAVQAYQPGRLHRNQIASWRMLSSVGYSWTSDEWKAAVQQIREYLDVRDREGTYVREEWVDVTGLRQTLEIALQASPTLLS